MTTERDYYEILNVSKSASFDEIKKAYREAVLKYHPDRVPQNQKKQAEENFKEISEAYAVLSDAQKRAVYDQQGHSGIDQRYTYEDIFKGADFNTIFRDLSDFGFGESLFDTIFSDFGFDLFGRQRTPRKHQHDLQITMDISLEEAAAGAEKSLQFPRFESCPRCGGRRNDCPECQGQGRIRAVRKLTVSIPPGVDTGSRLRLQGEGEGGQGDLYVVIQVKSHPLFRREGSEIVLEKTISLTVAVLGGVVDVPTLFGKVEMKVPPGTQNGQLFRLKGKGMLRLADETKGDEIVQINVAIPKTLTSQQKKLMEAFAKAYEENL